MSGFARRWVFHLPPFIDARRRNAIPPRVCPGLHFAGATLFIIIASVLHTFMIVLPLPFGQLWLVQCLRCVIGAVALR